MMSLTPFFTNSFVPTLSTCTLNDCELDNDVSRIYSTIKDQPTVFHRQPNYSLVENDQQAHLEIELPGVSKENITLDIAGTKLFITAKRFRGSQTKTNETENPENAKDDDMKDDKEGKQPIPSVVYELKIRIGPRYDTEKIEASMDGNGILKMVIPMKKKEVPRRIEIE